MIPLPSQTAVFNAAASQQQRLLSRAFAVTCSLFLTLGTVRAQSIALDFTNAVPGTLADTNGQGVGFINRLPGTGASIPTNDPNWQLGSGHLAITSTQANLEWPATNLNTVDAPCVSLVASPLDSIDVFVRLLNVNLPSGSDHAGIVVGTSAFSWVSVYVHQTGVVKLVEWNVTPGGTGQNLYIASGCFGPGDNVELRLTRAAGLWQAHWRNTTTASGASSAGFSIPWLDAASSLHAGVVALNTGTASPFVAHLDVFEARALWAALDFNSAVPGTLADSVGQGVGFTNRLPGTGASIAANDPNWVLGSGVLRITSQQANPETTPQTNLALMDAPCILVPVSPPNSIDVLARLLNVNLTNSSDHAGIVIGTSASSWLSLYVHETSAVVLTEWNVPPRTQGVRHYLATGCFNQGDDVELRLTRTAGQWQAHWRNLTASTSGSSNPVAIPWLTGNPALHVGVVALNTGTTTTFVTELDAFEVALGPFATAAVFGSGCGNPALALGAVPGALPVINSTAQASLTNIPSSLAFVALGWSNTAVGPFALPFPLVGYGMNGCQLWQSADAAAQPTTFTGPGAATYSLPLPNWSALIGVHLYLQGWAPAPGANPAGVIVSNGLDWRIGN